MKKALKTIIVLTLTLICCVGLFTACDGETTLDSLKNDYGIVVDGGGFKEGSTLVGRVIDSASDPGRSALEAIEDFEYNKDGRIYIFDISVLLDGVKVQPDGKVKVTLPVQSEYASNFDVFHIKDNNTAEKLVATYSDGKVSFETDSFSLFVLIEDIKYNFLAQCESNEGGYITENGEKVDFGSGRMVDPDTQITLTAVADDGYVFGGWYCNGQCLSENASYTFIVTDDMSVDAAFVKLCELVVSVNPVGYGYVTENENTVDYSTNGKSIPYGGKVELVAEANEEYQFVGWYDADTQELIMEDNVLSLRVMDDRHVVAQFKEKPYTLELSSSENGFIELNGEAISKSIQESIDRNASVTVKATAFDSYEFAGWYNKENSSLLSNSETYTFTMDGDKSIEAKFNYTGLIGVWLEASPEGSGRFEYNDTAYDVSNNNREIGTEYKIKAIPTFGYKFSHWEIGTKRVTTDVLSGTVPSTRIQFRAVFDKVDYCLEVKADGNGKITDDANDADDAAWTTEYLAAFHTDNNKVKLYVQADEGYHFVGWFNEENECIGTENQCEVLVEGKIKLVAKFEKDATPTEVTLKTTAGEGGTVTEDYVNGKKVEKGSSVTISATPSNDYRFVGWYVGETKVSGEIRYTFTINEDTTLLAKFEKVTPTEYTVTATAGEGGTVTDGYADGKKVEKGASVTLTATANNYYDFVGWYSGTQEVSIDSSYTFTVSENITLVAKFEKQTFRFMCDIQGNGSILENNENVNEKYKYGTTFDAETQITLTAKPDTYWQFKGWYQSDGTSLISTDATYTFELTDHTMVCAIFEEKPMINFLAYCAPMEGGYITENNQQIDFENGRLVEPGTKITLTAVANEDYTFKGWYRFTADQQEELISNDATYEFTVNESTNVFAKFEEKLTYIFLAQASPYDGGYITENSQNVDFGNGRKVEPNAQITLTAVANDGYKFICWGTRDNDDTLTVISNNATHTFTVSETNVDENGRYYVQAVFEEKATGLKLDAHNAGFTYNESGELVTTVYQIGDEFVPNIDYVGVYATYPTQQEKYLTINEDYTRDLGGLDFTKKGTYTVTYTYKEDTNLKATLVVEVVAPKFNFLAQCNPNDGGYITENSQNVDFGNGRMVEVNTQITLTAVANDGYKFIGWGTRDNDDNLTVISTDTTHTFTVTENTYVQAVFEEKPNGLKLDAHNAGFTYNEDGELVTTVYQIGSDSKPNAENVLVYATYPTQEDKSLTKDTVYTIDLGGLDFTKTGTYTVTYTYKADTSLTATLTVQVVEKPADGSLTEAEWNAAMAYWKAQTNIKVFERTVTSQSEDHMGPQIMIYQLADTAYSYDGYFENEESSQTYKGKMTYLVKVGDKYYRYTWNDGDWDEDNHKYVNGFWVKDDYSAKEEYESEVSSNIYSFRDSSGDSIVFSYANFTFDAEIKSYKNSDGSLAIAFTFDDNKVLTKIVVTVTSVYEDMDFSSTTVSTVTFGDAVVDVPTDAKCSFSTAVTAFITTEETEETEETYGVGGYITENGEQVSYNYTYLDDGTTLTLTAVADEGYVFKHWAKNVWDVDSSGYVWVTYSTDATYTVTADGEYGALYAVFEKVEAES